MDKEWLFEENVRLNKLKQELEEQKKALKSERDRLADGNVSGSGKKAKGKREKGAWKKRRGWAKGVSRFPEEFSRTGLFWGRNGICLLKKTV